MARAGLVTDRHTGTIKTRKPGRVALLRLAMWERLVDAGGDWMECWDEVVRHPRVGIGKHAGREKPMSAAYLHSSWQRAMSRHCPQVLERITSQARLSLASAASPAVKTVVQVADPARALTHKDFAGGEKNKLEAAKFVLGSLGVGPDARGGVPGAAVQVNVSSGGNAEVRQVMDDPELHAEWLALQKKARERHAVPVDAEVSDAP